MCSVGTRKSMGATSNAVKRTYQDRQVARERCQNGPHKLNGGSTLYCFDCSVKRAEYAKAYRERKKLKHVA
jgi:hypothetical protein